MAGEVNSATNVKDIQVAYTVPAKSNGIAYATKVGAVYSAIKISTTAQITNPAKTVEFASIQEKAPIPAAVNLVSLAGTAKLF